MKKLKLLAVGIILLVSSSIQAQVSVNLNIGTAPAWGPSGYAAAEYYYLPDVQAYYDVRSSLFVYFGNGRWVRSRYLPRQYRNYDLYSGYKVVLNGYHGQRPYAHYNNHRQRYSPHYRSQRQRTIGQRYDNHRDAKRSHTRSGNHRYAVNRRSSNDRRYSGSHKNSDNHKKYDNRRSNSNKKSHEKNSHGKR
ncbi:hypothetical protein QO200_11845 [Flavobacterium sp. Arc3]|uniref:hypothetical protein n=1 Tax=Flavobacterium sp. Arc3 TaxID=3046686 RepID=UPI00352BDEBE